jgi:hypothetical protein
MHDPTLAGTTLDRYYHVCAFFNSRDEEYRVLGPFFREGLEWGEKELHICNPAVCEDHRSRLRDQGVDVEQRERTGQLELLTWQQAYLTDGAFDQDRMLTTVERVLAAGTEAGYPRTRIVGNMDWVVEDVPGTDQLIEYEVRVNEVLARSRQPAVCVYDMTRLTGAMMMDILRSHPMTLIGGVVHENPFFSPPDEFLAELRRRRAVRA